MSEINTNDLNEQVEVTVHDAEVVTVPIDATLSNSGEAADAKAVGDALALKADADAVVAIKVNGQAADNQGLILIDGSEIPVSGTNTKKISEVLENVTAKTAENIPMSSDPNAKTIAEVVNENAEAIENMQDKTAANIPMDTGSSTTIKVAIESLDQKTVKTINKKGPDADGDVDMSVVPLAENLQSDKMQSIEGSFIQRTTGGNGSVSDGKAYPQHIYGHMERTGYVAEELNLTVIPMPRTEPDEPITATIDRDTFVAYVDESGTIDLYYTTEWSADPTLYGVTVTGTPVAGDQIEIVYVKEERGTILVADPERLVATGWNLFNYNKGYAKVVKYSSEYGYKVGGGYTSLSYSATLTGERASITPNPNGLFSIPGDGYVFVNGGNGTDTYILATWSDWMDGPSTGYWEPYRESSIELESVIGTYLPNGMLAIGNVKDEIDFSAKRAISRVERMAYSEENLAAAIATGRAYIYDTDYIYLVRAEAVISAITIDSEYTASEHGLEYFTETVMPLGAEILYGKNLRDKLERDVLTISEQTLTAEEQAQVRKNIGAMNPPGNNGTEGQLLKTNGDGSTSWTNQGTPSDAQVGTAVTAWLNAHPEATTTVEDGAVSRAKLNDDLKAKTDKIATLEGEIATEKNVRHSNDLQIMEQIEIEAGYRKNTDDEIKSNMVPFPVSPDAKYGTSGQVLRTKGNGKTEWADVGLPTDEQTEEAVTAWLNDHPEATTTVEDGSITEAKLSDSIKASIQFVFDTVADMAEATGLEAGMSVRTLGFYTENDAGGAIYQIQDNGTANGIDIIAVSNELKAKIVLEDDITLEQLGAKAYSADSSFDCKRIIERAAALGLRIKSHKKIKSSRFDISNVIVDGLLVYLPSTETHEYGCSFTSCEVKNSKFESNNDQSPAWSGGSTNQSNIDIKGIGSSFENCVFSKVETLAVTGDRIKLTGLKFENCSSGITLTDSDGAIIRDVTIETIDLTDTTLFHALYFGGNVIRADVDNVFISGSRYFPIHIYNSNTQKSAPDSISIKNIVISGTVVDLLASNADNIVFDNIKSINGQTSRYLFGYGTNIQFRNCDINGTLGITAIDINETQVESKLTLDRCTITNPWISDPLISNSTYTDNTVTIVLHDCITNELKNIATKRNVNMLSINTIHNSPGLYFDNAGRSAAEFDISFINDVFNTPGKVYEAYAGKITLMNCFINMPTVDTIFTTRSATFTDTEINASNVTIITDRGVKNYIFRATSGDRNNLYNQMPRAT